MTLHLWAFTTVTCGGWGGGGAMHDLGLLIKQGVEFVEILCNQVCKHLKDRCRWCNNGLRWHHEVFSETSVSELMIFEFNLYLKTNFQPLLFFFFLYCCYEYIYRHSIVCFYKLGGYRLLLFFFEYKVSWQLVLLFMFSSKWCWTVIWNIWHFQRVFIKVVNL